MVLSLIFLKYAGDHFDQKRNDIVTQYGEDYADIPPKEYEDDFNRKASLLLDYIDILSQESHHLRTLLTLLTSKLS